jgi:hypothetical protein
MDEPGKRFVGIVGAMACPRPGWGGRPAPVASLSRPLPFLLSFATMSLVPPVSYPWIKEHVDQLEQKIREEYSESDNQKTSLNQRIIVALNGFK